MYFLSYEIFCSFSLQAMASADWQVIEPVMSVEVNAPVDFQVSLPSVWTQVVNRLGLRELEVAQWFLQNIGMKVQRL